MNDLAYEESRSLRQINDRLVQELQKLRETLSHVIVLNAELTDKLTAAERSHRDPVLWRPTEKLFSDCGPT